mmetsp:Transcript_8759/g.16632  ORF Transcript_8759/g.16632 Transcript_8759/m.16632 type:complete len:97 (+) Transcript_8759:90-380(+)
MGCTIPGSLFSNGGMPNCPVKNPSSLTIRRQKRPPLEHAKVVQQQHMHESPRDHGNPPKHIIHEVGSVLIDVKKDSSHGEQPCAQAEQEASHDPDV